MSLYLPPGGIRKTTGTDLTGKCQVSAKDALQRWGDRAAIRHVIFEPLDLMAKLAALVPKPRANLTRYHGVLAPNSKQRIFVAPAKRGKGNTQKQGLKADESALVDCHQSMTWAERLKRVFNIDITICSHCGGAVRIIGCVAKLAVSPGR